MAKHIKIRSAAVFTGISTVIISATLPPIVLLAQKNNLALSSTFLLLQACLFILGILVTRRLTKAFLWYGYLPIGFCNALYAVTLGMPQKSSIKEIFASPFDSLWYISNSGIMTGFLDSVLLILIMNAFLITFLFWLEKHHYHR